MEIHEVATRLDAIATRLAGPGARAELVDPGPGAFGATASGECGGLGRALAGLSAGALAARDREATRVVASATALAEALRDSVTAYRDAETGTHRRVGGV
jgi:hypothetical protein